ncbi:MAG: hypothetical protein FJZ01_26430 [Candidatus Sericytochromatia bacterium]|nr:hypothetical protein [Candidatus Tanganyikabacteria bacterium]
MRSALDSTARGLVLAFALLGAGCGVESIAGEGTDLVELGTASEQSASAGRPAARSPKGATADKVARQATESPAARGAGAAANAEAATPATAAATARTGTAEPVKDLAAGATSLAPATAIDPGGGTATGPTGAAEKADAPPASQGRPTVAVPEDLPDTLTASEYYLWRLKQEKQKTGP